MRPYPKRVSRADLLPLRLWQIGIPLVAALVGLIAGVAPSLGIALALGIVYVATVLQSLALGLSIFILIIFLESASGIGSLSAAKLAGGLLVLGWAGATLSEEGRGRQLVRDHPLAAAAMLALGAWATMSALWAELPDEALSGAQRWVLNLAMFPIVYTALRKPRHVRWVFALFVVGALLSAGLGLATGSPAVDSARLEGSGVNANELGLQLVVAAILAAALGAARELPGPVRMAAWCAAGLSLLALISTASRGALVGLVVALLVAPLLVGRGRRMFVLAIAGMAVAAAASYAVVLGPTEDLERITESDATGTGRTEIWTIGWRMVQDRPLLGVGADNYGTSTIEYLLQPGGLTRSEFFVDENKVAHNVYLQVIAELGIIGLVLFAIVIGFTLWTLWRAARDFEARGARTMGLLSRALLIALCGHLAAWTFSSDIYSKQLWLLLAVAVAIGALSRSEPRSAA